MTLPNTHLVVYKWKPLQANQVLKAFEREYLQSSCPDCFRLSYALQPLRVPHSTSSLWETPTGHGPKQLCFPTGSNSSRFCHTDHRNAHM